VRFLGTRCRHGQGICEVTCGVRCACNPIGFAVVTNFGSWILLRCTIELVSNALLPAFSASSPSPPCLSCLVSAVDAAKPSRDLFVTFPIHLALARSWTGLSTLTALVRRWYMGPRRRYCQINEIGENARILSETPRSTTGHTIFFNEKCRSIPTS
jgi:hypothetical protein